MIPIQDLLNRIRWDQEFAQADFKIGYYDRVEDKIIIVPFGQLYFEPDDHFYFSVLDNNLEWHSVPLHRIKQVYRNEELIWERTH